VSIASIAAAYSAGDGRSSAEAGGMSSRTSRVRSKVSKLGEAFIA
jgi:hypothetical protein